MRRCEYVRPMRGGKQKGWGRGRALLAVAGILTVLGGCEGQGLYDVPAEPGEPGPGPIQPGTGRGEVVTIPGVGIIADLLIEPASQHAFLSNVGQHRLEVLNLDGLTFRNGVPVGSQPRGLALNLAGDRVIVANSGASNISFVDPVGLQEDLAQRFDLPRVTLYEYVEQEVEETGAVSIEVRYYNYADRPQFVAQDSHGRLVYSAVSTQASPAGTLRLAERRPGWQTWDTRLLFADGSVASNPPGENRAVTGEEGATAIANLDSMTMVWREQNGIRSLTGEVVMFDHRPGILPGAPNHLIRSDTLPFFNAFQQMRARGSDVVIYPLHRWNIPESSAVADTTFVAASADRQWIAVGEGLGAGAGRILLWGAGEPGRDGALSRVEDVRDIVNNTSDRVFGVDLNANGTLGAARGAEGTYFFGRDLRLQGTTGPGGGGARGIAFLPGANTNRTFAFEPTHQRTVRVVETTHYRALNEITIREAITGPFRVGPPRPGVDACPNLQGEPTCVVATAYGVTAQRRLLVLDIQRQDIVQ